jgi:hypothetical protein
MTYTHTAKHAFFYLISFFALSFTAIAIGQVIFQLINFAIVDTTANYYWDYHNEVLRFAISSLIIAAPIYYFFTRKINTELATKELDPEAAIRKWLTYLALFIASAIAIGDLIFTLNSFLAGEVTIKFFLKALTILTIAGGFGSYYLFDLKRKDLKQDIRVKFFGGVFIVVVLACLVVSFSIIDSPKKARELREDEERVEELQDITWSIRNFYDNKEELPQNLNELLSDSMIIEEVLLDPVTKKRYEFEIDDETHYKLCANFAHPSKDSEKQIYDNFIDPKWGHKSGHQCFEIEIDERANFSDCMVPPIPAASQENLIIK